MLNQETIVSWLNLTKLNFRRVLLQTKGDTKVYNVLFSLLFLQRNVWQADSIFAPNIYFVERKI